MSTAPNDDQPRELAARVPAAVPAPVRRVAAAAGITVAPAERRFAYSLFRAFPTPLGSSEEAAWCWFRLMEVLADPREKNGLTAKQVASREGFDKREALYLGDLLDRLADAGDLRRTGSPTRYAPQPFHKSLPRHLARLRAESRGPKLPEWEAFELAAMEYEDDPRQAQWTRLKEALVALADALPGWPERVRREVRAGADRWAGPAANVRPPSHVAVDDEWAQLRLEAERLREENEKLRARASARDAAEEAERKRLQRRVEALEAENASLQRENSDLREQLDGLEEDLGAAEAGVDRPELRDFLDGKGRGVLPAFVADEEVERLRKLVAATRAPRDRQLVLAERLGDIYRAPHQYQRLTSMSFQQAVHPYETLHRVAVYKYRIGYGLAKKVPYIVDIGPRENFYARFLGKL